MQVNEHITAIIGKKLEGQATTDELAQLQRWLDSGEGNAREYVQLAKIWTESPRVLTLPAFDTQAAWQKVDGIIRSPKTNTLIRTLFFTRRAAIAAAVIIVAAAGWLLYNRQASRWQTVEALASNQSLQLPDGSRVELRKGSRIEYPAAFGKTERRVRLNGEAFFSVQPNEHQPFCVSTTHAQVEVIGTSFLIRSDKELDEIVVSAGSVSVTATGDGKAPLSDRVIVNAGRKLVLENDHFRQTNVTDANYLAWKTGILEFKAAPLTQALEDISHYYNIPLGLAGGQQAASKSSLTVRFENEPFENVLEELQQVTGLQAKKENGKVFLYQK